MEIVIQSRVTAHESAEDVLRAAERCLDVGDGNGHAAHACREHVHDLVADAALRFARAGQWDESFRLMASVRLDAYTSPELFRLRNALTRYERNRVTRLRRRLVYLLVGVLAYLLVVSPSVFVALENPYRIAHGMSELDWSEGLYWSVITSTTVGYGDVVPYTPFGRMFALFDALLGVLLMGVTAGLILSTLTPRRLD